MMPLLQRKRYLNLNHAGVYAPAGAAWTPASLGAALLGWWKADAGVTPGTNGSNTTQWDDQSGNANHLVNAATGPVYTTGVQNSLPGLVFSTGGSSLQKASFALGGTTASVFMVAKISGAGASNPRLASYNSGGNDTGTAGGIFFFTTSGTDLAAFRNGGFKSQATVVSGTFYEMGSIYDGANSTVYLNNSAQTPVAETNTWGASGAFGINMIGAATFNGTVCEMFITNTAISGTDRTSIASYFTSKWAV